MKSPSIGADGNYCGQDLPDLIEAVRMENPAIKRFETSVLMVITSLTM